MLPRLHTAGSIAEVCLDHLSPEQQAELPATISAFLDVAATSTARASFYNTREEQEAAVQRVHDGLMALDRGIYTAALLLDGETDYTRQLGVLRLLSRPHNGRGLLAVEQEWAALNRLLRSLPPQRMFKLFEQLRRERVNNARTRRLVLSTLLGAGELTHWAVKYRRKLAGALAHAWGNRTASMVAAILRKPAGERTDMERRIVTKQVGRYVANSRRMEAVEQSIRFVLGDRMELSLPGFVAYREARTDLTHGTKLPYEVLEGIRSRYHPEVSSATVLNLTKAQLTTGQRMALQRKAEEAHVEVHFDPADYDAVRLYLYAFERGMTAPVEQQLRAKAEAVARRLPVPFDHVGVLLDASASMVGDPTQRLRPMAAALALRDVLVATADRATARTNRGQLAPACQLVEPAGETDLGAELVNLLRQEPDIVFVLSDGYENAPAGRFAQVVRAVRNLGIETPIIQFNPVFAAEASGVRTLSSEVTVLPVDKPAAMGLPILKTLVEVDVRRAVGLLLQIVQPRLVDSREPRRLEREGDVV